jgi:type I restriction enzyme S subunit
MLQIVCVLPEAKCAGKYTECMRPLFQRIAANRTESATLATLRDALLPKLISGELRVPEAERIVGRAT